MERPYDFEASYYYESKLPRLESDINCLGKRISFRRRFAWDHEPEIDQIAYYIEKEPNSLPQLATIRPNKKFDSWAEDNKIHYVLHMVDFNEFYVQFFTKRDALKFIDDWC